MTRTATKIITTRRRWLTTLLALGVAVGLPGVVVLPAARADVTQDPPEKVMTMMIEATKNRSYADFLTEAADELKAELSQQSFDGVCGQISGRLQKGYKTKYLTKLKKEDQRVVYLWKLEYADGKDDSLILLAIKDKKVGGILLQ